MNRTCSGLNIARVVTETVTCPVHIDQFCLYTFLHMCTYFDKHTEVYTLCKVKDASAQTKHILAIVCFYISTFTTYVHKAIVDMQ